MKDEKVNPVSFRPSPSALHTLREITQNEGANRSEVIDWCLSLGRTRLSEQSKLRASFGDQLINTYGTDAVLSALISEPKSPGDFRVRVQVNGQSSDLIGATVVKAVRKGEWHVVLTATKSKAFPDLILDTFHERDVPLGVADRIANVPFLPLLDGPGGGAISDELKGRRAVK